MATTRAKSERLTGRFHLLEASASAPSDRRVDMQRGIVYSIRVLGRKSRNGRVYTDRCLREAVDKFRDVVVNADHPDGDPDDVRSIRDRLGVLKNPRYRDGAIYADLHLITTHPLAKSILEAATKPELAKCFGASQNGTGQVEVIDGVPTVMVLETLNSVDIVSAPATVQGLFESFAPAGRKPLSNSDARRSDDLSPRNRADQTRGKRKMKLLEYVGRIKLLPPTRQRVMKLIEAYSDPDAEVSVMEADDVEASAGAMPTNDPADMDPEAALRAGFRAAIMAIVDDQTLPAKDKIGRFKELVMTAEKLLGQGVEIPEAEEDSDLDDLPADESALTEAEGCDDPAKKPVAVKESVESLKRQNAQLIRERAARELCETNGVRPTAVLLEALAALDSDAKRLSLLEAHRPERKAKSAPTYDPSRPSRRDDEIDDTEAFVRAVTRHGDAA